RSDLKEIENYKTLLVNCKNNKEDLSKFDISSKDIDQAIAILVNQKAILNSLLDSVLRNISALKDLTSSNILAFRKFKDAFVKFDSKYEECKNAQDLETYLLFKDHAFIDILNKDYKALDILYKYAVNCNNRWSKLMVYDHLY